MTKLLTSTWMTAVISGVLYLSATMAFWKNPTPPPVATESSDAGHSSVVGPSWEFVNPEADQLIQELNSEKKALSKKEQELTDLSARLQAEHAELNQATQTVAKLQADFDKNVLRIHEEETANLKKLAKVYSAMTPDSAAGIFSELDDAAVVKIMAFMKDSDTAGILEAISKKGQPEAKRAAALSERLRLATFRSTNPK